MSYDIPNTSDIKNTRLRAKLSQDDCAYLVCATKNTWSRWELGHRQMPAGIWKLFLLEIDRIEKKRVSQSNEVNEANVVDLKQISNGWE